MKLKILTLILLLLLLSCTSDPTQRPYKVPQKTGYGELELSLQPFMPPGEILEGDTFVIGVKVHNKGAYETKKGRLSVAGLNAAYNELYVSEADLHQIYGSSLEFPNGEFYIETFEGKNILIPAGTKTYSSKFWVIAEYDYKSQFSTNICINPTILGKDQNSDDCISRDQQTFNGQGGPLGITKLVQNIYPTEDKTRLHLTFHVENRGTGAPVSDILIDNIRLGKRRLNCKDRPILTPEELAAGESTITCTITEPNIGAYTTTLSAVLYYTYKSSTEGEFVVTK